MSSGRAKQDLQKKIREKVAKLEAEDPSRTRDEIEIEPRAKAELSADALRTNYGAILTQLEGHALLPMIKANAYGHGAVWAARILNSANNL